jgi:hypothetical protein
MGSRADPAKGAVNEKGLALGIRENTQLSLQPMGVFLPVDPLRAAERQRPGQLQGAQLGDQAQATGLVVLIAPSGETPLLAVGPAACRPSIRERSRAGRPALPNAVHQVPMRRKRMPGAG